MEGDETHDDTKLTHPLRPVRDAGFYGVPHSFRKPTGAHWLPNYLEGIDGKLLPRLVELLAKGSFF